MQQMIFSMRLIRSSMTSAEMRVVRIAQHRKVARTFFGSDDHNHSRWRVGWGFDRLKILLSGLVFERYG